MWGVGLGKGDGGASITSQEAILVRIFNLSHCKGESLIKPTYILGSTI